MSVSFDELFGSPESVSDAPGVSEPSANVCSPEEGSEGPSRTPEPYGVSWVTTPNGTEIYYQAGPKRLYRIRATSECGSGAEIGNDKNRWLEVPSVSQIKEIIDRSGPLTWWGMKVGIAGALKVVNTDDFVQPLEDLDSPLIQSIVSRMTASKLTVNHVKDDAGARGTSVHDALELWANQGVMPVPETYPENEQGYVRGLVNFLQDSKITPVRTEVMVGSLEREYAGRFDLDALSGGHEVCVHLTEKGRGDKRAEMTPGFYRLDLKTSKDVYVEHFIQLAMYEKAAVECGYEKSDFQAVVNVKEDGRYQVKIAPQPASTEAAVCCRMLYGALQTLKGAK